jgi:tripeptidyl-peptidase-1
LCLIGSVIASFPKDWTRVEAVKGSEELTFHVALKQHNVDLLEVLLMAVSDPRSPRYGQHATNEEISALVSPPKSDVDFVASWFRSQADDVHVTAYDDALKITSSVNSIAKIFGGVFHWYKHGPSGHKAIRTDDNGISIPEDIQDKIQFITGLVSFPIIQKARKNAVSPVSPDAKYGYFAPSTLRMLYNIPGDIGNSGQSTQAAIEFSPEGGFVVSDLQTFAQQSDEVFHNFSKIIGPYRGDGGESQLDVQLLMVIGNVSAENWFWTIHNGWIYEMAVDIYNAKERPWVYSISYGWPEIDSCNSAVLRDKCGKNGDSADYVSRANTELMKLGALGLTVITCSQDEGAPSEANSDCSNKTHPVFGIYPGSSPYVTTVSGTTAGPEGSMLNDQFDVPPPICNDYACDTSTVETPCTVKNTYYQWTTGGGFSEFTPRPSYQDTAVLAYLNNTTLQPPAEFFWPANRGYPDVSAIGARVLTIDQGEVSIEEGTSASTPIIAGIATLLNDVRFQNKKAALGFLNPMLYQMAAANPTAFKDITKGDNTCSEGNCCKYGYYCGAGWDAVTGLGTPNVQEWIDYVKTLP